MINSTANKQVKRVVNLRNRAKARRRKACMWRKDCACAGSFR